MYGSGGFLPFVQEYQLDTHTLKIYWMQSDQASGILILFDLTFLLMLTDQGTKSALEVLRSY